MICPICGQPARFVATTLVRRNVTGRAYYHEGEIHHEGEPQMPPVVGTGAGA